MRKLVAIAIAALAAAAATAAAAPTLTARARTAHALNGNGEAHLRYVRSSGSTLIEEGPVSGSSLSGHMRARLHVAATFSGRFTFYTRYGQLDGGGSAKPHGSGRYESFSGTDTISGGTGRYAHASGHGTMYGTFDRKNYDVTIQTRGTLHY